jgi:hypothetical protein
MRFSPRTSMNNTLNKEFAFDVTLVAALRVRAPSESAARTMICRAFDCADASLSKWPDGTTIAAELSTDQYGHDIGLCYEIDGTPPLGLPGTNSRQTTSRTNGNCVPFCYSTAEQASAFLDGIEYANDSALTTAGVVREASGAFRPQVHDEDRPPQQEIGVQATEEIHRALAPSEVDTERRSRREAFERGFQSVLGNSAALPHDPESDFFNAGRTAGRRELVDGGGRDASASSDEYWEEFLELRVLAMEESLRRLPTAI